MSEFNVDNEIAKILEKHTEDLKIKIKKIVARSEKNIIKQCITQKTNRTSNSKNDHDDQCNENKKSVVKFSERKKSSKKRKDDDSDTE